MRRGPTNRADNYRNLLIIFPPLVTELQLKEEGEGATKKTKALSEERVRGAQRHSHDGRTPAAGSWWGVVAIKSYGNTRRQSGL